MPAPLNVDYRLVASTMGVPTEQAQAAAKPTSRYLELAKLRELPRTLIGGTDAMREAGEKFLPRHPAESEGSYALRLNATTLYNGFSETVTAQSSKFFGEPLLLGEDVPTPLVAWSANVDGQGRSVTPFANDLVKEAFVDGISFILVDFPQIQPGATMADQLAMRAQPYWVLVTADNLIGWRFANVNGRQVLTQARVREVVYEPDGEFGDESVQKVRVLEPGAWRVYALRKLRENEEKRWVLEAEGPSSLPYVPLVPFYTNRLALFEGQPPLRSLAELNQEHWISSSEQRRALSFLRFAMLAISGVDSGTPVTIGPDKVLTLPVGATAAYVEHSGAGISSGQADIDAIERRMASAGMELRVENAGSVTATAAAIDSAETNAGLLAVAHGLEAALTEALQMTADLLRIPKGGSVAVYDDFGQHQLPGTTMELLSLRTSGALSQDTLWTELKRRHVLDEDFDPEKEAELLSAEQDELMTRQQQFLEQQAAAAGEGANPAADAGDEDGDGDGE